MASFNRVILVGNLTRDPQLSYTPSNTAVCEFGLAVNRRWRDRDGNQQDEVTFVDVNAFGKPGEIINQYMTKGSPILVEGRLRLRQWTNKEGQNRSKLDVVVENFTFLGGGGGGGGGRSQGQAQSQPSQPRQSNEPYESGSRMDEDVPPPSDSDIPF